MKKYLVMMTAALGLAACVKNESNPAPEVEYHPIPVTLEATIGSNEQAETKLSYSLEGGTLKSSWQEGDEISLISFYEVAPDGGDLGKYVCNDIFTAQSSGKTVKFTGTFSNPTPKSPGVIAVKIVYPALKGSPLASPKEPQNNYDSHGPFYIGEDKFLHLDRANYIQPAENSTSNLGYYTLMVGGTDLAQLKSGNLVSTTLLHQSYVLKANLTMPGDGTSGFYIKRVTIVGKASDAVDVHKPILRKFGMADFYNVQFTTSSAANLYTYMHHITAGGEGGGLVFSRNQTYSVYFVGGYSIVEDSFKILKDVGQLEITAEGTQGDQPVTLKALLTATGTFEMIPGYMYTLNATLAKVTQ